MESRELRMGNYVTDEYPDGSKYMTQVGISQMEYVGNCEPITLTEEWLLKFGFKKKIDSQAGDDWWCIEDKGNPRRAIATEYDEDLKTWLLFFREDIGCGWCDLNEVEYVHELQNVYQALTFEELEIQR